jgi:hypothetical protein
MSRLQLESYEAQRRRWPAAGRHILAQYDEDSVVVYQAFRPEIARYAVEHQRFGGPFSLDRMSWVKPNFLWMMYRCGWATKENQEAVLAVRVRRSGFDEMLRLAVHSNFQQAVYADPAAWSEAVKASDVRLQWDPDHTPTGEPVDRRAIQLGLRGHALARYAGEWVLSIQDATALVKEQAPCRVRDQRSTLCTPREDVYPVNDRTTAKKLGVDYVGE